MRYRFWKKLRFSNLARGISWERRVRMPPPICKSLNVSSRITAKLLVRRKLHDSESFNVSKVCSIRSYIDSTLSTVESMSSRTKQNETKGRETKGEQKKIKKQFRGRLNVIAGCTYRLPHSRRCHTNFPFRPYLCAPPVENIGRTGPMCIRAFVS